MNRDRKGYLKVNGNNLKLFVISYHKILNHFGTTFRHLTIWLFKKTVNKSMNILFDSHRTWNQHIFIIVKKNLFRVILKIKPVKILNFYFSLNDKKEKLQILNFEIYG